LTEMFSTAKNACTVIPYVTFNAFEIILCVLLFNVEEIFYINCCMYTPYNDE